MRTVLRHIMSTTRADAELAFLRFLRDDARSPRDRLVLLPCMAPFILDVGELNRYTLAELGRDVPRPTCDVLRDVSSDDHRTLNAIVLDEGSRARCTWLVDRTFELFATWVSELQAVALAELSARAA